MIVIDKLCYYSKLRYVNAGEKFAFAMISLLFCVITRSIAIAIIVLIVNGILTVKKGGIPLYRYRVLLTIPLAFLLLSTIAIIVNISKIPLNLFAIPVGSYYITGSWSSLLFGIQLILTALASVSCLYFLSLNTPMTDILLVLRNLHCPEMLLELMLLIYRFIFVLLDISSSISTSQDSRLGNKDYKTSLKCFGSLASVLLIRAMKKSNSLYDSMESRCYDGTIRVLNENSPPKRKEILSIFFFELFLLCITIGRLYL